MNNYPKLTTSEEANSPWNKKENKPIEIEVTVCLSISKTFKITVDDYKVIEDDDGTTFNDYSYCNLEEAVEKQIYLPHEVGDILYDSFISKDITNPNYSLIIKDVRGWNIDDFKVIQE